MTTIAWDGEMMASDSQMTTRQYIEPNEIEKIFASRYGLVGMAGDWDACLEFKDWFLRGNWRERYSGNMEAILVRPAKTGITEVVIFCGNQLTYNVDQSIALGSGVLAAQTALNLGHDSLTAVKQARKMDVNTGGTIRAIQKWW